MVPKVPEQSENSHDPANQMNGGARHAVPGELLPILPLIERIVAHLGPEEIWLFGSRAEGRARPAYHRGRRIYERRA